MPDERPKLLQILSVRGTAAWRKWLEDAANAIGGTTADVVDEGLELVAKKRGLPPPPNRTGDQ